MDELIGKPISNKEMYNYIGRGNVVIKGYDELHPNMNLDQLFDGTDALIILYLIQGQNSGHWCCMLRKKKNIEFFDSYGKKLDYSLKYNDDRLPIISEILLKNGVSRVENNVYPFQKADDRVSTCGRYCVWRVMNKDLSLEEFQNGFLRSDFPKKYYDVLITLLTSDL
jgi:hypothetical protein